MKLGFINLNKPAGFTSHDCVAKVRRILKIKKVGHGGTLDPAATGVLPIAVGKATRLLQFLPTEKAYRARIRLGMKTTTDDLEGEIIATQPNVDVSSIEIQTCLAKFIGKIEQVPPIYSAIKKQGKKLYELARKGEKIDVPPRLVTIKNIELINIIAGEFTEIEIAVACGSGTYIRSIARDLGEMLGVGGTLANLIRTQSCGMNLTDSITLEQLEEQYQQDTLTLIPPAQALNHLQKLLLNPEEAKRWCQGQTVAISSPEYLEIRAQTINKQFCQFPENYLTFHREKEIFLGISTRLSSQSSIAIAPKIVCVTL